MTDMDANNSNESNDTVDKKEEYMLTTMDNPFNPFTDFDKWDAYDREKGYHTCSYLARIVGSTDDLSEEDEDLARDQAIDEIVELNLLGNYVKVTEKSWGDRSHDAKKDSSDE